RIVENAGASAITVHGRTRSQMFGGEACWEGIKTVKDAVNVPVIGNGDVKCPIQTKKWMEESCVDAVMIGRGSYGDPWVFKRIATYLETGELLALPTFQERIGMAISHTKAAIDHDGEKIALREMRKHIAWYIKGLRDATIAKVAINNSQSFEEIYDILTNLSKSNIIES
ncbi:MAG: tRNA-dihydrouridine synthase, partial [Defluviitaleaceae bacterium]|nr:tRNA-dihydrouridine synthase [Defluviitaleaceae bacterium]